MIVDEDVMYKTIKSPRYIRKEILTTGINFIELIKLQQMLRNTRDEKQKVSLMLTNEVKNTKDLLHHFYELIPKARLEKLEKSNEFKPKIRNEKIITEEQKSRLDYLDRELSELKSQLDNL